MRVLCDAINKGLGAAISKYFSETKWIFVLDRALYDRYLGELRHLISFDPDQLFRSLTLLV
jgi:hypothetical protein